MKAAHKFNTDPSMVDRLMRTARSHFRFVLKSSHNLTLSQIRDDYFKLHVIRRSVAGFELADKNDRFKGDWVLVGMGAEFLNDLVRNNDMIGIPSDHALMHQLRQNIIEIVDENKLASVVELTRLVTRMCDELFEDFYRRHAKVHALLEEFDKDAALARLSLDELRALDIDTLSRRQLQIVTAVMLDASFDFRMNKDNCSLSEEAKHLINFADECVYTLTRM